MMIDDGVRSEDNIGPRPAFRGSHLMTVT
jgi:hypothetical protein